MKIAVVGATGRTGRQVVEQALARGDHVMALARHPEAMPRRGQRMVSAAADVLDRAGLAELLAGADALLLGRRTYEGLSAGYTAMASDPFVDRMNSIPKSVASRTLTEVTRNTQQSSSSTVSR